MSVATRLRKLGQRLRRSIRRRGLSYISCSLFDQPMLLIDFGASYYPHMAWEPQFFSNNITYVCIDPNAHNLTYVHDWSRRYSCRIHPVSSAVSGLDGVATLYITNVDSGSSLLRPSPSSAWMSRVDRNYFYPLHEKQIDCISALSLLDSLPGALSLPVWLKLDLQGMEGVVLKQIMASKYGKNVVLIETESPLQSDTLYEGASDLANILGIMKEHQFEMLSLRHIEAQYLGVLPSRTRGLSVECDVLFARNPSFYGAPKDLFLQMSLISAYLCHGFFYDALLLADTIQQAPSHDPDLVKTFQQLKFILNHHLKTCI
jgi:FkbM family methyltransferase